MEQSPQIEALAAALAKAQAKIEGAAKTSTNPHLRSKYADLASVWDAVREPLTSNGLAVVQMPSTVTGEDGRMHLLLSTTLMHATGQWMRDTFEMPMVKQDAQGVGSALTYARRYALMAVTGVAPEDDDGDAASQSAKAAPVREAALAPKVEPVAAKAAPAKPKAAPKATNKDERAVLLGEVCEEIARRTDDRLAPVKAGAWARLKSWYQMNALADLTEEQFKEGCERLMTDMMADTSAPVPA